MPPVIQVTDQFELVPTSKYPYAKFFFESFNPVQSRVFDYYDKDCSLIVASSTSSGKTATSEMIAAYTIRVKKKKALYLAPMRALAQEKYDDWTNKNHHFSDLNISICTGDYRLTPSRKEELEKADIIIMSSEMLSHRTRNHKSEHSNFLSEIGVLIADEIQLLAVPSRGDHVEAGLMKFTEINPECRLVLLSATMPNVAEIADWVSYILTQRDTVMLTSNYRPCPLNIHYEKYYDGENTYDDNELQKVDLAMQIVEHYPEDKFLIFAHTKRTGDMMKQTLIKGNVQCEFHNADLDKTKRTNLEKKFKEDPKFRAVVATSTLAWGCACVGTSILMSDYSTKTIENVKVGDFVLAKSNNSFVPKKVLRVGPTYAHYSLLFSLISGEEVTVSPDHRFLTESGYSEARGLKKGDKLATLKGYSEVSNIERLEGQVMHDIEVEGLHNYVSGGIVSHNCNLPARRVIILGIHRGISEVATYDIFQMIGRAGRPAYDPVGDAYILLPERTFDEQKARLRKPQRIESQMLDKVGEKHKTLAFHLVSEVFQGNIKCKDDVYYWYKRSLACFQSHEFDDTIVDSVIELLRKCGAIWQDENNEFTITTIGKVASLFYYSPLDVSDLKRNFTNLFEKDLEENDFHVSYALGNVDTQRSGIVSRVEREEMGSYAAKINNMYDKAWEPAIKAGYAYYLLLNGRSSQYFASITRGLQFDFSRLNQVLFALESFGGNKWGKKDWLKALQVRIAYGVDNKIVPLCAIDKVGKVRATRLYEAGIRTAQAVVDNEAKLASIIGTNKTLTEEILASARLIAEG
jgi:replicative superfamily II helicase